MRSGGGFKRERVLPRRKVVIFRPTAIAKPKTQIGKIRAVEPKYQAVTGRITIKTREPLCEPAAVEHVRGSICELTDSLEIKREAFAAMHGPRDFGPWCADPVVSRFKQRQAGDFAR